MPRNVRNFWMEARVDDRESKITGGPVKKDGGLEIRLYQRDEKSVLDSLRIDCWINDENDVCMRVIDQQTKEIVFQRKTVR